MSNTDKNLSKGQDQGFNASGYKEYRSVSEFPKHTQSLNREQLETCYQELRGEYRSLVQSRGQLVRRQIEAKGKLAKVSTNLQEALKSLDNLSQERERLQKSLVHSMNTQGLLQTERQELNNQVAGLRQKLVVTQTLIKDFEAVYSEVNGQDGILSIGQRFFRLIEAARRLLNTDVNALLMKRADPLEPDPDEEFKNESQANRGRRALDEMR